MELHTFGWELCTFSRVGTAHISWKLCTFAKRKHCIHFVGSFVLLTRDGTTYITFIWKLCTFVKRWHCTHLVGNCVLLPRDSTAFIKLEALHFCQEMALHTFSWELYTFLIFPRDGTGYFGWDMWTFAKRWHCKHLVRSFALSQELPLHTYISLGALHFGQEMALHIWWCWCCIYDVFYKYWYCFRYVHWLGSTRVWCTVGTVFNQIRFVYVSLDLKTTVSIKLITN